MVLNQMGIWDNIPKQVMASDLPDELIASVEKISQAVNKNGNPVIQFTLRTKDDVEFVTTFKIPKAWTGKGQADLLKAHLEKLGIKSPEEMLLRTFQWKREELEGSMKGFDRHYPIAEIKSKSTRLA